MIRFCKPFILGNELDFIDEAIKSERLSGDGAFTARCSELISSYLGGYSGVLLTHSCTAALEMAAILTDIKPGDEVIMPSYTFVSTANAFVLRGGIPVFVDIRNDTLNINEELIEKAITPKTKAIVAVHYAGVSCEMDKIVNIARRHHLWVIEDAAQALGSSYRNHKLGTIGHLATFSFHETKNIISGEGGALIINDLTLMQRAEIIREKGTNRSRFFRGEVDKYTWVDIGSSYLPSELVAAFLYGQLLHIDEVNIKRMQVWDRYHKGLKILEKDGFIRLPIIPAGCEQNAHMFYLLTRSNQEQIDLLKILKTKNIGAVFHYVPLHSSEGGIKFGRTEGSMVVTDDLANRLVRLPLYPQISVDDQELIIQTIKLFFKKSK